MATFKARVEDYLGTTFSDTDALDGWLSACAKYIIDILPQRKLDTYATSSDDDGATGVAIEGKRFVRAEKSGYGARFVPSSLKGSVSDSNSIHYPLPTDPVVYIEKGTAYVKPSGGTVHYVNYPTVANSDSAVADFPDTGEQAIVLYTTIQAALSLAGSEINNVAAMTFSTQTAPTAPSAPSFTYTDATGTTVAATTIDISLISAPTYTKPTVSLTAAPTDLTISASAPSAPTAPTISYSDASGTTVTETSIDITTDMDGITALTQPVYTKPTVSLTAAPSDLTISASAPSAPLAPSFSYSDATLGTYTDTSIGSLGTAPTYTKPTTSADFTDTETYIGTEEDLEKAQAELQNQRARLENYQMDLYNELNEFNKELEVYKSTVQKAIEEARLDQQRILQNARDQLEANLQNEAQTLVASIKEYESSLRRYQAEISQYQAEVTDEVQEYGQNLQKWIQLRNTELQEFQLDIQNELNEYNEDFANYRTKIETKYENARLLQQKLIDDAARADNIALQNEIQTLQAAIADYRGEVERYIAQIQSYNQEVNAEVQQYAQNLAKWQKTTTDELQNYALDIQNELNEYSKDAKVYDTNVGVSINNAQLLQQKLLDDAQRTDQIAMQNRIKQLEEQVSQYNSSLGKYSNEVNQYGAEVNEEVSRFASLLQSYNSAIQGFYGLVERLKIEYAQLIQVLSA